MNDKPHWPVLEVRKAANGWMVRSAPDYSRDRAAVDDFYVFREWPECSDFIRNASDATFLKGDKP